MAAQQYEPPQFRFPLVPKKRRVRASDRDKAFEVEPLDQLPSFLLESSCQKFSKRPPTLHLGWRTDDVVLVRLCRETGIGHSPKTRKESPKGDSDGHIFDSDDGSDEDHEEKEPGVVHRMMALRRRCKELQLNVYPDLVPICDPTTKTSGYAVSVLNNYNFENGKLDMEDWPKLMNELGLEGLPKWYLDFNEWYWD